MNNINYEIRPLIKVNPFIEGACFKNTTKSKATHWALVVDFEGVRTDTISTEKKFLELIINSFTDSDQL